MFGAAIAPLPDSLMTAQQDSVLFESIGKTILQFAPAASERDEIHILAYLTQPPETSDEAISAFQCLSHLLRELRSSNQSFSEGRALTPEELVPYVMEEALDVLEALQTKSPGLVPASPAAPLIRLDSLVSPILWAIARSAYPVMGVLEGMRACARLSNQPWISGVLRLVPLLELSAPNQYWQFDLATGRLPQNLIDPDLQIQPEKALFLNFEPAQQADPTANHSASHQLQGLLKHLAACNPSLQALFQGIPVDLLLPKQCWLEGELRLSLNFEFVAQEMDDFVPPVFQSFEGSCIEAEFMEEQNPEKTGILASEGYPAAVPLSVIELPLSLLEPTTLIRIPEPLLLDRLTQPINQQIIATAIAPIGTVLQAADAIDPILAIVRTADSLKHLAEQSIKQNFSLLQPELLIDELVPKLLWQLSRSSYSIMQWIGGLSIELLQPNHPWTTGTLRLMSVLALSALDRTWHIDLATGRFIPNHSWQLNSDAVVMAWGNAPATPGISPPNSMPTKLGTLLDQLQLQIQTTAPDVAVLQDAIAVEWLTSEQEWQPGQLAMHWGFEWAPDVY